MDNEFFERDDIVIKKVLPNPELKREKCVPECMGCNKMYSDIPLGKCCLEDHVCIAYISPKQMQRNGGCALKSNRLRSVEEKKKVNPIKWSKRGRR